MAHALWDVLVGGDKGTLFMSSLIRRCHAVKSSTCRSKEIDMRMWGGERSPHDELFLEMTMLRPRTGGGAWNNRRLENVSEMQIEKRLK